MSILYESSSTITVNQNAKLFDKDVVSNGGYEFIININVDANNLFTNRTYTENQGDIQNVNFSLALNADYIAAALAANNSTMDTTSTNRLVTGTGQYNTQTAIFSTFKAPASAAGKRFLEIAAVKIFRSAYATAAIRNDSAFTESESTDGSIYNQIVGRGNRTGMMDDPIATNHAVQLSMFNAYVSSDRYVPSNNDQFETKDFNFQGTIWEFPVNFSGEILDSTDTPINSSFTSTYGGNYNAGSRVLLRFVGQ